MQEGVEEEREELEEQELEEGPLASILGSVKKTISTASGLR